MFEDILFFVYILASFAGILAIIMAVLLIRYREGENRVMLGALTCFEACAVVISVLYFGYYFMKISSEAYFSHGIVRVTDIWMYIGQAIAWAVYVCEKSGVGIIKKRGLLFGATAVMLAASAAVYGFMMDGYYFAGRYLIIDVMIEVMVSIFMSGVIVGYTYRAMEYIVLKKMRCLILGVAAVMLLNDLWNTFLSVMLMRGIDVLDKSSSLDMTPVMLLIISALTLILIAGEDFSSFFTGAENEAGGNDSGLADDGDSASADGGDTDIEVRLNVIAVEHRLTEREREIFACVYNGMTNPQIAEQMYISQNTVKRHVHNVFEKLDVYSRIELIHMVNNWKDK